MVYFDFKLVTHILYLVGHKYWKLPMFDQKFLEKKKERKPFFNSYFLIKDA